MIRKLLFLFILLPICLLTAESLLSAQDKAYLLGPRDVITITIHAGGEKQHEAQLTVSEQGTINVPFIGSVKAEGLTTLQLESQIKKPLAEDYFLEPEVNINVKEYHSLRYYISGAVTTPGLYETASKATVMKLIAKAGGVLPTRGNVAYIFRDSADQIVKDKDVENLVSKRKREKVVDLKELLDKGNVSHDLPLESGDVVYIPPEQSRDIAETKIYVEGEVKKPGVLDYRPGITALSACIMAGGFDQFAAPNRARIIRKEGEKQVIIDIDLNKVKKGEIPDVELKPGDLLHIPETWL